MEFFLFLIVLAPVLYLIFWIVAIRKAVKFVKDYVDAYEREQRELSQLLEQARKYKGKKIPQQLNNQVSQKLFQMQNELRHMNTLQRQKYEANMSGMIQDVSAAGFTNFNVSDYYR